MKGDHNFRYNVWGKLKTDLFAYYTSMNDKHRAPHIIIIYITHFLCIPLIVSFGMLYQMKDEGQRKGREHPEHLLPTATTRYTHHQNLFLLLVMMTFWHCTKITIISACFSGDDAHFHHNCVIFSNFVNRQ